VEADCGDAGTGTPGVTALHSLPRSRSEARVGRAAEC
jgi:hypothetical protein